MILFLPLICVYTCITYQGWHVGILWLLILTYLIMEDKINTSKVIKIFVTVVCIIQVYWSANSYMYEIMNKYSASEEVANFIKRYDYQDLDVYGWGYSITAIQPYFKENIFDNLGTDVAFKLWKVDDGYLSAEEFLEKEADIYVFSKFYTIIDKVYLYLDKEKYKEYEFNGYTYLKDNINESEGYWVLVKK